MAERWQLYDANDLPGTRSVDRVETSRLSIPQEPSASKFQLEGDPIERLAS